MNQAIPAVQRDSQSDDRSGTAIAELRSDIASGLRVIITAGAAGIGAVMAEAFANRGASVWICDISPASVGAVSERRPDIKARIVDVGDVAAFDQFFDEAENALGGLDVLVNNAGTSGPTGRVEEIDPADWDQTLAVCLSSHFYSARRAVPMLRESRGVIINISSVAGRLAYALRTPYAAAKWGVIGLTKSLAKELGGDGVRVNAILPGAVTGERMERVIRTRAEFAGISYDEARDLETGATMLGRWTEPEDIASMALYLCSPAGSIITGQALSVCGGFEYL